MLVEVKKGTARFASALVNAYLVKIKVNAAMINVMKVKISVIIASGIAVIRLVTV